MLGIVMGKPLRLEGMAGWRLVWFGQVLSQLGSSMSSFALTIWVWQATGKATSLALIVFFTFGSSLLLSPLAGALVDRWNRKTVAALSDLGSGVAMAGVLVLWQAELLAFWHVCALGVMAGAFQAFQFPAFAAMITVLVRREEYGRANGMMSLADSLSRLGGPLLAGGLMAAIGFGGILLIDLATFAVAVLTFLFVTIPGRPAAPAEAAEKASLWEDSLFGLRYILARPSLLGLQSVLFANNLVKSVLLTILPAMVLARSGNDELALGTVQSAMGAGAILGGTLLSLWGGPRSRVHGVLVGVIGTGLAGGVAMGLAGGVATWSLTGLLGAFFSPWINGCNQAIWQTKVPVELQGRVFSARLLLAQVSVPIALLLAGPLVDRVFVPAMEAGGALAGLLGEVLGVGTGGGLALLFVVGGLASIAVGVAGYLLHIIRDAERILPDPAVAADSL
jgi:DHA3 family macrolide efflux protein-like MFS transporter